MARTRLEKSADKVRIGRASVTKWQIKVLLTTIGLGIMATVLFYTKTIVDELVANERRTVELYANLLARSYEVTSDEDLLFYVDLTYNAIHFPVILTDKKGKPVFPYRQFMMNVDMDTTLTIEQQQEFLVGYLEIMRQDYQPLDIKDPDGKVVQKIYFANSAIVRRLRFMPYIEILIVTAFVLIGYVAFSTIRRNEESNIWVGMAKEAAHQLGTPLSSILAWIEILKLSADEPGLVEQTAEEIARDVDRLNVIANRFSKIGSQPNLVTTNISSVIEHVVGYFEKRLPNLGKKVRIERRLDVLAEANINVDLFEWVIENLIKNAVEAIERADGIIVFAMKRNRKGGHIITVTDNGKGMTTQLRSKVFQPGYTTKKRGWGLGLSLSKRIIEDYHGGKLTISESQVGIGTTFMIELP